MCTGILCRTTDPSIPLLCPECLERFYYTITSEEIYEMMDFIQNKLEFNEKDLEDMFQVLNSIYFVNKEIK